MDRARALLASLRAFWLGLARVQQIAIIGITVMVVAALAFLVVLAQQPEMVTVFRNLPPEEAAQIVQRLQASRTPYVLTDGGATIQVPAAQANQVRLDMASAG